MRLAVISDIHSNLHSLEAVIEDLENQGPDHVVVAGDFLNRGPCPAAVLSLLCDKGWPLLRGNHEDYVIAQLQLDDPSSPLANPLWQPARWTSEQVPGAGDSLDALPLTMTIPAPDGTIVLIVHGTPQANNEGVFDHTTDDEIRTMLGTNPPPLFICAHTHASLLRRVDNTFVVNVGSAGLPFNGDPRAQYGIVTWQNGEWHAELRAVEYDRNLTLRAFAEGGFLDGGGPLARVIRREVEDARPHLGPWVRRFSEDVRLGRLTVQEAVEHYL